jgi:hypothetical protein
MALSLTACGTEHGAGPSTSAEAEIIVSAPIPRATLPGGAGLSGSVVFVSATPEAATGAAYALVSRADGQSAAASVRDGGFDPIAIAAASGEVVELALTDSAGATTAVDLTVRAGRPPRVVRMSPAQRRTDVPLNTVIRVVFSAPVQLESARSGIVLTTGAGVLVPGTVEAVGESAIAVDFVTAAGVLEPETSYRLEVTVDVRDVLGQALAEPASVEFRTGSSVNEVARVEVYGIAQLATCCTAYGANLDLQVGDPAVVTSAYAWSADGYQLDVPISWQSDDPAVARVAQDAPALKSGSASVAGVGRGRTTLVARHGNLTAALRVMVWDEVPAATFANYRLVVADGNELVALNGDGSGRTTLMSVPGAYSPSAAPDGRIVFSSGRGPSGFPSSEGPPTVPEGALAIRAADGTLSAFATGEGAAICPAWSPDARQIAFTRILRDRPGSELVVRNADGSGERVLATRPFALWPDRGLGQWMCPHWSPDGGRIAYWIPPFSIRSDGTDSQPLFAAFPEADIPACGGCSTADGAGPWSPDGRTILSTTNHAAFGLRDVVTGVAWVGSGAFWVGAADWSPDGAVFALGTRGGSTAGPAWEDGLWLMSADGTQRARVPGAAGFYGVTFAR